MNKSELHLFIIWQNGRYKEAEVLTDIAQNFTLLRKYAITWTPELVSSNFTRFYGVNLPSNSFKEIECGTGEFLLCVVRDENPIYEMRLTSRGLEFVNVNMFDAKDRYRAWTGGGHKIHGTNSEKETNHDLTLLIGKSIKDFLSALTPSISNSEVLQKDVEGAKGWDSIDHLFYVLNNTVSYVVLRGVRNLFPEDHSDDEDTDILTSDYENMWMIVNGKPRHDHARPKSIVSIGGVMYLLDIWDSRKDYYDLIWMRDMLSKSILKDGIKVLDDENDCYCLLYHCLTNKGTIAQKHLQKLNHYKQIFHIIENDWNKVLIEWLSGHNYDIIKHKDSSNPFVISDPIIHDYATRWGVCIRIVDIMSYDKVTMKPLQWESRVYEKDTSFVKKGTPWLIDNEKCILSQLNFDFIPKLISKGNNSAFSWIEITRVEGEELDKFLEIRSNFTITNLRGIIEDGLKKLLLIYKSGVMHRDIIPDNILVYKQGGRCMCNIIDFGSSIMYKEDAPFPSPQNLGKMYIPEYMYSDFYSFGKVSLSICRKMPYLKRIANELSLIQWDNYRDEKYVEETVERALTLCRKPMTPCDHYAFLRKKYSAWHKYIDQPILILKQLFVRAKRIFHKSL